MNRPIKFVLLQNAVISVTSSKIRNINYLHPNKCKYEEATGDNIKFLVATSKYSKNTERIKQRIIPHQHFH
jgi:hypothetical protein